MRISKENVAFALSAVGFTSLGVSEAVTAGSVFDTGAVLFFVAALGFSVALAIDLRRA